MGGAEEQVQPPRVRALEACGECRWGGLQQRLGREYAARADQEVEYHKRGGVDEKDNRADLEKGECV